MVVGKRRIFDINFPNDANLDFFLLASGNAGKIGQHLLIDLFRRQVLYTVEQRRQLFLPVLLHLIGFTLVQFIGQALVVQRHQQVGIQHAVYQLDAHAGSQREAFALFQSGKV